MERAFEAVEQVAFPAHDDLEDRRVTVLANLANRHRNLPPRARRTDRGKPWNP
jgi:hypothetical protein